MEKLLGKVFTKVCQQYGGDSWDMQGAGIAFYQGDTKIYVLQHMQNCCESVDLKDVCGNLSDLENSPILKSEERCESNPDSCESVTWSFYEIATIKGSVTISFLGESNGYYSETAELYEVSN